MIRLFLLTLSVMLLQAVKAQIAKDTDFPRYADSISLMPAFADVRAKVGYSDAGVPDLVASRIVASHLSARLQYKMQKKLNVYYCEAGSWTKGLLYMAIRDFVARDTLCPSSGTQIINSLINDSACQYLSSCHTRYIAAFYHKAIIVNTCALGYQVSMCDPHHNAKFFSESHFVVLDLALKRFVFHDISRNPISKNKLYDSLRCYDEYLLNSEIGATTHHFLHKIPPPPRRVDRYKLKFLTDSLRVRKNYYAWFLSLGRSPVGTPDNPFTVGFNYTVIDPLTGASTVEKYADTTRIKKSYHALEMAVGGEIGNRKGFLAQMRFGNIGGPNLNFYAGTGIGYNCHLFPHHSNVFKRGIVLRPSINYQVVTSEIDFKSINNKNRDLIFDGIALPYRTIDTKQRKTYYSDSAYVYLGQTASFWTAKLSLWLNSNDYYNNRSVYYIISAGYRIPGFHTARLSIKNTGNHIKKDVSDPYLQSSPNMHRPIWFNGFYIGIDIGMKFGFGKKELWM